MVGFPPWLVVAVIVIALGVGVPGAVLAYLLSRVLPRSRASSCLIGSILIFVGLAGLGLIFALIFGWVAFR